MRIIYPKTVLVLLVLIVFATLFVFGSGWLEDEKHDDNDLEAHYSSLAIIDDTNVSRLGIAWTFSDFLVRGRTHRGMESTPVVVDGRMYVTGPWSTVYALDARNGALLWKYDPEVSGSVARKACCDVVNRGVAVTDGKVFVGALDGRLIALDAVTGGLVWSIDTFDGSKRNYTITGAPRIAGQNVVIGNGGADMGVRGYVTAYDRESGRKAWRFYTVPGDPKAGPDESPAITLARKTWSKDSRWDLGGGGTVWDSMTYDSETGTLYVGVGNGSPHPAWIRSPGGGDNLFVSSIVALNAETGKMKWYYQTTPGESWDYTATQNMIPARLKIDGKERDVLMQAPKNGFFYVLDANTGKLISADPYTTVTWAKGVDPVTGRPILTATGDYSQKPQIVWPAAAGGHNWQPMAFSPQTGLVYIPVIESPLQFINDPTVEYRPGSSAIGHGARIPPFKDMPNAKPTPVMQGVVVAWDPLRRQAVWKSEPMIFWNSGGVLATAGGVLFQGGLDGILRVYDARNGRVLASIDTGTAMWAAPMSYEVDGVQYVAIAGGYGGALGSIYFPGSAPLKHENAERLFVFRLDGQPVELPPKITQSPVQPAPSVTAADQAAYAVGQSLYLQNCARCHSYGGPAGNYPNLWNMPPNIHSAFSAIVMDGALSDGGMAAFRDVLTSSQTDAIHSFLKVEQAQARATEPPTALGH